LSQEKPYWRASHAAEFACEPISVATTWAAFSVGVTTIIPYPVARAGSTLDDDQPVLAGQRGDGPHLLLVEVSAGDRDREAGQGGADGERTTQVGLDPEHITGRQCSDVLRDGVVEQRHARSDGTGGQVFGQLDTHRRIGDHPLARDEQLDLAADVGGVPCGSLRPEPRQDCVDRRVTVQSAGARCVQPRRASGGAEPEPM